MIKHLMYLFFSFLLEAIIFSQSTWAMQREVSVAEEEHQAQANNQNRNHLQAIEGLERWEQNCRLNILPDEIIAKIASHIVNMGARSLSSREKRLSVHDLRAFFDQEVGLRPSTVRGSLILLCKACDKNQLNNYNEIPISNDDLLKIFEISFGYKTMPDILWEDLHYFGSLALEKAQAIPPAAQAAHMTLQAAYPAQQHLNCFARGALMTSSLLIGLKIGLDFKKYPCLSESLIVPLFYLPCIYHGYFTMGGAAVAANNDTTCVASFFGGWVAGAGLTAVFTILMRQIKHCLVHEPQ